MRSSIAVVSLLIGLAGCNAESTQRAQTAPAGSTVSIVAITPDTGAALKPGQKVNLSVKAAYTLTAESGTLGLVVQDASNAPLAQTMSVVLRGSGTEELAVQFTVPETTRAVQVFVPLSAQDQSSTATVSSRAFKVSQQ
jgi:hypothetical protein